MTGDPDQPLVGISVPRETLLVQRPGKGRRGPRQYAQPWPQDFINAAIELRGAPRRVPVTRIAAFFVTSECTVYKWLKKGRG